MGTKETLVSGEQKDETSTFVPPYKWRVTSTDLWQNKLEAWAATANNILQARAHNWINKRIFLQDSAVTFSPIVQI